MLTSLLATALLALPIGLSACASDEEYDPSEESKSPHEHYLIGFAYADGPIRGAHLRVYSIDGELLADEPRATEAKGTFYVEEPDLPAHYTVVATGGTHEGKPFKGELRAEVRDDDGAVIHLSPVSTITSHHMEQNPDASHDEATDEVHEHLAIPSALETDDLRLHDRYFHGDPFLAEARRSGGVRAHAKELAEDAAGDGPSKAFPGRASNQVDAAGALISYFLTKVADEAVARGMLAASGTDKQLEKVHETLAEIKGTLSGIQAALAEAKYAEIVKPLPLTKIDYALKKLQFVTSHGDANDGKAVLNDLTREGGYIENNLQGAFEEFHRAFTAPGPGQTELMTAFGDVAKRKSAAFPMFTPADNKRIFAAYDYYDLYLVTALYEIAVWRREHKREGELKSEVKEVLEQRKKHAATLPSKMPHAGLVDTRTSLYWHNSDGAEIGGIHCSIFHTVRGQAGHLNYTSEGGFKNWRLAKWGELEALVKDRGRQKASDWLETHGVRKGEFAKCGGEFIYSGDIALDANALKASGELTRRCQPHMAGPPYVGALRHSGAPVCVSHGGPLTTAKGKSPRLGAYSARVARVSDPKTRKVSALYVREINLPGERYW